MTESSDGESSQPRDDANSKVERFLREYYSEDDPDILQDRRLRALHDLAYGPSAERPKGHIIPFKPRKR